MTRNTMRYKDQLEYSLYLPWWWSQHGSNGGEQLELPPKGNPVAATGAKVEIIYNTSSLYQNAKQICNGTCILQ